MGKKEFKPTKWDNIVKDYIRLISMLESHLNQAKADKIYYEKLQEKERNE